MTGDVSSSFLVGCAGVIVEYPTTIKPVAKAKRPSVPKPIGDGHLGDSHAGALLSSRAVQNKSFALRQDKYRAQQDQWRIAESQLHLWSFAGGWIGAWVAQQRLRHKTRKQSFRAVYWFSVAMHCAALAAWLWLAQKGPAATFF